MKRKPLNEDMANCTFNDHLFEFYRLRHNKD